MTKAGRAARRTDRPRVVRAVSFVVEILVAVLVALLISAGLRVFVFQVFKVPSGSMESTLELGDRIVSVRVADFQRGDIIVFEDPNAQWMGPQPTPDSELRRTLESIGILPDSSKGYLVKRIIGLPGDHVECCNQRGNITINGVELIEDYLYTDASGVMVAPSETAFDVVVPANSLFVLGDHRDRSGDSRLHLCQTPVNGQPAGTAGFVPFDNVVGPVKAIGMPVDRITTFEVPSGFAAIPDGQAPPEAPVLGAGTCD